MQIASKAGNIFVAKKLLDLGATIGSEVVQSALCPKMLTLLIQYNANAGDNLRLIYQEVFLKFIKSSPQSAVAILDQHIGTNHCDQSDSDFLITMDLGFFNDMRIAERFFIVIIK